MEFGTSERALFKRCRRRWDWQSLNRQGLQSTEPNNIHLFIGTGVHFALEDWHGIRTYGSAAEAFREYVGAHTSSELPDSWADEDLNVYENMLEYYSTEWEPLHLGTQFETLWLDEKPMVEVRFEIGLNTIPGITRRTKVGKSKYTGTFDRIVRDIYDRYWVMDYKTAQQFDTAKLQTDQQIAAYTWAAQQIFGVQFEGVIWVQMLKDYPKPPKLLQKGGFSKAKDQRTTHALYRRTLIEELGSVPQEYVDIVNHLAMLETEHGNKFARFDQVFKNQHSVETEANKIVLEAKDMLAPKLPLYPNPTRDCGWDCPFRTPCIALDDGLDVDFILSENYQKAPEREDRDYWRPRIEYPSQPIHITR